MLRRSIAALAIAILGAPGLAQGVGTPMPRTNLQRFAQTDATSLDDFYGRAILLEFFADWCHACESQVAHLNSLQAKYAAQGLTIVGVTGEAQDRTQAWVRKHGARYAYAYDPTNWLSKYFGVTSIPYAVLVDPNGIVAWAGHPARLEEGVLRKTLAGAVAQPISGWPKSTMKLQLMLRKGSYAQALSAAVSLGEPYESFVRERVLAKVDAVQRAHDEGNYLAAMRLGDLVVKQLSGLREAVAVKSIVDHMRRDKEVQRVIQGQEDVSRLIQRMGSVKDAQQASQLVSQLSDMRRSYSGTIVSAQAEAWLKELERRRE